ncbi:CBS domain-containing protein, partial [Paenibacillus phytorum]
MKFRHAGTEGKYQTKDVKVCAPHDSVVAAAKLMRDINCGSIPVCEGKK